MTHFVPITDLGRVWVGCNNETIAKLKILPVASVGVGFYLLSVVLRTPARVVHVCDDCGGGSVFGGGIGVQGLGGTEAGCRAPWRRAGESSATRFRDQLGLNPPSSVKVRPSEPSRSWSSACRGRYGPGRGTSTSCRAAHVQTLLKRDCTCHSIGYGYQ